MHVDTEPFPYRLALAGGWIDQPFINRLDPSPPGSMVVVSLESRFPMMERSGMATSTRKAAARLWKDGIPEGDPSLLVRTLFREENRGRTEPSGSQDMVGLIYPGISRLDYDHRHEFGIFPRHIESCLDPGILDWLEASLHLIAVGPRPAGYSPLEIRNLDPHWIRRLGRAGSNCFDAILGKNLEKLGDSLNDCMSCWEQLLPGTVKHPALERDLSELLGRYQGLYPGAMYSGCGGGYLIIAAESSVPGSFRITIKRD